MGIWGRLPDEAAGDCGICWEALGHWVVLDALAAEGCSFRSNVSRLAAFQWQRSRGTAAAREPWDIGWPRDLAAAGCSSRILTPSHSHPAEVSHVKE